VSSDRRVVAVDLGAASIRVAAVDLDAGVPEVEVLHRWRNAPVKAGDGTLRWDWPRIVSEVETGLAKAVAAGPVASIGVDGWGVDYGLIDSAGVPVALPFSYRDLRTASWESVLDKVGADHIYELTGIQLMAINTLFQLAVHDREELDRAAAMLLLPDLLVHALTGTVGAERSNASTTAMLSITDGRWLDELVEAIGLQPAILPGIIDAPGEAGSWQGIPVTTVGSHDTASAFLGMPGLPEPGTVFVSSGTWVLVGVERDRADTSEPARLANFSNERGALGGFRLLKNLTGFWMLEQCRPAWGNPPVEDLLREADAVSDPVPLVDATDARFVSPDSMLEEIIDAAGFEHDPTRPEIVRCILESIAGGVGGIVEELSAITGTAMQRVYVVGGSARVDLLNRLIAERTGLPVTVGASEATALGNAVVQGVGVGHFASLDTARRWLRGTGVPL
jgi:rhamnulokinase